MTNLRMFGTAVAIAALVSISAPRIASADAMSGSAMVDCKSASMMMGHDHMMGHDDMKGHDAMGHDAMGHDDMKSMSMDQQFLHTMMDHNAMGMKMAKTEAQCGKDAKTRAMAQKLEEEMQRLNDEIRNLLQRTP